MAFFPCFPTKMSLSPLLGPCSPDCPSWPLLRPPASLLGQGTFMAQQRGENLPKMWRVNFRGI